MDMHKLAVSIVPKASKGFTIVELLIVIVVIAILAVITIVAYNGIQNYAKTSASKSAVSQASKKIMVYAATNSEQLPADLATAGLVNTADTTYQYTRNTNVSPNLYCITTTSNGISSHIATNGPVTDGPCPGHTGTPPAVAASGGACPSGFIVIPGSSLYSTQAFCVMKYEAKAASATVPVSQAAGGPWGNISQTNAIAYSANVAGCTGCHLMSENEWLTLIQNVLSVPGNWSGGTVGSGFIYSGNNDNAPGTSLAAPTNDTDGYNGTGNTIGSNQRRTLTLTNGEVIWDLAGNMIEWTSGTALSAAQPGFIGDVGYGYRQHDAASFLWRGFKSSQAGYINANAGAWNSTQGIGQIMSHYNETSTMAVARGGNWLSTVYAGVLSIALNNPPSFTNASFGFRVAR